jgi:hypothetical protein
MDLNRGQWAMSFEGVSYMPMMHKIMMGDSVPIIAKTHSLMSVIDQNGKPVR